jgi:hypothetical protein
MLFRFSDANSSVQKVFILSKGKVWTGRALTLPLLDHVLLDGIVGRKVDAPGRGVAEEGGPQTAVAASEAFVPVNLPQCALNTAVSALTVKPVYKLTYKALVARAVAAQSALGLQFRLDQVERAGDDRRDNARPSTGQGALGALECRPLRVWTLRGIGIHAKFRRLALTLGRSASVLRITRSGRGTQRASPY